VLCVSEPLERSVDPRHRVIPNHDRHAERTTMSSNADNDAIQREHHTISTEQARTIFRTLDDLTERVETLERRLAAVEADH